MPLAEFSLVKTGWLVFNFTGVEKKSVVPDRQTNWLTACHESGHALVAHYTEHAPPVHKVAVDRILIAC